MASKERVAVLDRELCKPQVCGPWLCQRVCPINRAGKDCITIADVDKKPLIDEELCISCMLCVKKCPTQAISIVNLPTQLDEPVIHRYGPNLFALYRLPVPKQSQVVGLIGANGTGKSTVLRILSGLVVPNGARFDKPGSWEGVLAQFKGTELQGFLERLRDGKIRTVYKPQEVDLLPRQVKGTVRQLLQKVDQTNGFERVVERLGLEGVLDREFAQLSGGELQLAAIAAALLKEAELYFFDEPSSYLDVYQRLKVAREIRSLSERAFVLVVEHDLAIADYLADSVHLLYGEPAVYGVVSQPYGVRVGINTFLEGYIREENMRIRPDAITFSARPRQSEKNKELSAFPAFEKRFPADAGKEGAAGFSLRTEAGTLFRGEIIGVLGPNGIGKTTFIKMLAGEDKDVGVELKMRLSYKPQRLALSSSEGKLAARDWLGLKGKDLSATDARRVLRQLNAERLLEKPMGTLSGGELQTMFICAALMGEAELLLLDEPSAFLDVEQRLRVAKLLRQETEQRGIPAFVVDHDLQLIDTISDRVMVFDGTPAREGVGHSPESIHKGMNRFLAQVGITFRRDPHTGRPRANKPGSQLDQEQKAKGEYYYAG